MRPPKGTKELWRMMGEERVNNELILKQYGIIALAGGMLKHKHFEVMRLAIGRHCDSNKKKTFSFYRFRRAIALTLFSPLNICIISDWCVLN